MFYLAIRTSLSMALAGMAACSSHTAVVADEAPRKAAFAPEPLIEEPRLEAFFSVALPACRIDETVSIVNGATVRNVMVNPDPARLEGIESRFAKTTTDLGLTVSKAQGFGWSSAELTPEKGASLVTSDVLSVIVPSHESVQQAAARWATGRSAEVLELVDQLGPRLHLSRVTLGRSIDGFDVLEISGHPDDAAIASVVAWATASGLPEGAGKHTWLRHESGGKPTIMMMLEGELLVSVTREGGPSSVHACDTASPLPTGASAAPSSSVTEQADQEHLLREMMGDEPHR